MKVYSTICSLVILVVPWCTLSSFASPQEEGLTETPASNEDPEMKEVGERPYEMADRKQEHRPQFDFEDLGGWRAACRDGARAKLVRTREQQMWGRFVGKLTYEGTSKESEVEIIPPKPIPIPDDATAVNLWMLFDDHSFRTKDVRPKGKKNWQVPFLLDFDLLRIHPLEVDNGAGPLGICPKRLDGLAKIQGHAVEKVLFRSPASDRGLAATIAFGHAGDIRHITSVGKARDSNIWRMIKTYYMIQQLQERYMMIPVEEIHYNHNGKLVTTSEAIATDAYKESHVYVKYTNGLEVYVNGSWDKPWRVTVGGQEYLLPPTGFVAAMGDELLVYSAEVDGKRVDYVNAPAYVYADARDAPHIFPELETDGAVAIKRDGDSLTAIIASPDVTKLTLHVGRLLSDPLPDEVAIEASDIEGNTIRRSKCGLTVGTVPVPLEESAVSYRIRPVGRSKGR